MKSRFVQRLKSLTNQTRFLVIARPVQTVHYMTVSVLVARPCRDGASASGRGVLSMHGLSHSVVRVNTGTNLTSLTLQDCGQVLPGGLSVCLPACLPVCLWRGAGVEITQRAASWSVCVCVCVCLVWLCWAAVVYLCIYVLLYVGRWVCVCVCVVGTMAVVKLDSAASLCKTDEVGELCLSANFTGTGYWGLPGVSTASFKVQ